MGKHETKVSVTRRINGKPTTYKMTVTKGSDRGRGVNLSAVAKPRVEQMFAANSGTSAPRNSLTAAQKTFEARRTQQKPPKLPPRLQADSPEFRQWVARFTHPSTPASEAKALHMVRVFHEGQTDQLGVDYHLHPEGVNRLMQQLPEYAALSDEDKTFARQAALLHDIVEDTPIARQNLLDAGFHPKVVDAVDAVSAREGEPKPAYYERVKADGPIATCVKLGDLAHNNLPERRAGLPGSPSNPVAPEHVGNDAVDRYTKLGRKYYKAFTALGSAVPEHLQQFG